LSSYDSTSLDSTIAAPYVQRQLDVLREAYAGRRSAFVPIYGRRRTGKSELILRFMREAPGLYYVGKAAPAGLQLRELMHPERSLGYYLKQLEGLRYVERRYPLTGAKPSARSVRYRLSDPLLRFWFRFVFPNQTFVQQHGPSRTYREIIRPELESYFGLCFERLCREALPLLYEAEGLSARYEVGEYWDRDLQIDLVGLRDDGVTDLGECKWGGYGGRARLVSELTRKVERYPNRRGATLVPRAFVRKKPAGVDKAGAEERVRWHDLDDLYARG
jgi:uncharacterized protein